MRKRFTNHFIPHEGNEFKPHFVRERSVVGIALLALLIFGLAFSLKTTITKNPDILSAVITGVLVDITNVNRLSENLNPLEFSAVLASAAQLKANDMATKGYFAHTSPEGKTPWYWFTQSGYNFLYAGENLAVNFVDSEDVARAWMNSAGHRANILNDHFTEIGIAIASGYYNGQPTIYVVQLFGKPVPLGQKLATLPIVQTETVEKSESILANATPPTPVVAAASAGQATTSVPETQPDNIQVLAETEMFVAVKNNDYATSEEKEAVSYETTGPSVVDRAITSPKIVLEIVYIILEALVLIGLILFVAFKRKREHGKHIVYLILLLVLITALLYLSSVSLFPKILVG